MYSDGMFCRCRLMMERPGVDILRVHRHFVTPHSSCKMISMQNTEKPRAMSFEFHVCLSGPCRGTNQCFFTNNSFRMSSIVKISWYSSSPLDVFIVVLKLVRFGEMDN